MATHDPALTVRQSGHAKVAYRSSPVDGPEPAQQVFRLLRQIGPGSIRMTQVPCRKTTQDFSGPRMSLRQTATS